MDKTKALIRSFRLVAPALLAIALFVSTSWPVNATIANNSYIVSLNSNKCVEVGNGNDHSNIGVAVQQWSCGDYAWQRWNVQLLYTTSDGMDVQLFVNAYSGLCMAIQSNYDGAPVTQRTCNASNALQHWKTVPSGSGYRFVNGSTGRCLDMGNSALNGFQLYTWSCLSDSSPYVSNQRFAPVPYSTGT